MSDYGDFAETTIGRWQLIWWGWGWRTWHWGFHPLMGAFKPLYRWAFSIGPFEIRRCTREHK